MRISKSQTCPQQLAVSIQAGDAHAEEDFCRQYRDVAIATLRLLTSDSALVEDIAHDALLTVLLRLRGNGIRNPERLNGYVRQTAKFKLISWYRRKGNRAGDTTNDIELVSDQILSEDGLIREQGGDIVRSLIDDMKTPRDQEILKRSYLYGEDKTTLCCALNLRESHFDRVIWRARQRLLNIVTLQKAEVLLALQAA